MEEKQMFFVDFTIDGNPGTDSSERLRLTGLNALDARRRLKLEDGNILDIDPLTTPWFPVPEAFARAKFNDTETHANYFVDWRVLTPNMVRLSSADGITVEWAENLPVDLLLQIGVKL